MVRAMQVFLVATVLLAGWQIFHRLNPSFTLFHDSTPAVAIANIDAPGQPTDITQYVVPRHVTMIVFYSNNCPTCRSMDRTLRTLVERRPRTVLRYVDIDRPKMSSIDFQSPLARQYGITRVPTFVVYDQMGQRLPGGTAIVSEWIQEEFGRNR